MPDAQVGGPIVVVRPATSRAVAAIRARLDRGLPAWQMFEGERYPVVRVKIRRKLAYLTLQDPSESLKKQGFLLDFWSKIVDLWPKSLIFKQKSTKTDEKDAKSLGK